MREGEGKACARMGKESVEGERCRSCDVMGVGEKWTGRRYGVAAVV